MAHNFIITLELQVYFKRQSFFNHSVVALTACLLNPFPLQKNLTVWEQISKYSELIMQYMGI